MMNSTNDEDPFLQVQQDVINQLSTTRQLFTSYLRIRSLSTSSTSPELVSAQKDLISSLETLGEDLADLSAAVDAVEPNPSRFGLSAAEVTRRRRLVQQAEGEVEDMRDELSKVTKTTTELPDPSSFALDSPRAERREEGNDEDHYAQFEQEQQVHMMREQDHHLDGVFQTVGNLRRQADDMGRELEEQTGMLEVVDDVADRVGNRLQTGIKKLRHVVKENEDSWSGYCIGLLIFVLILLLVLLLIL